LDETTERVEEATTASAPKFPTFGESPVGVALLCVLAALDCLMLRARVDETELQDAVRRKFEQAGVPMPDGLVETQDA
jgi:hypothetical protein